MPIKEPSPNPPWYVVVFDHCGCSWEIIRRVPLPTKCVKCGSLIDPKDYFLEKSRFRECEVGWLGN